MAADILVATRSADKLAEIREILPAARLVSLDDAGVARSSVEEDIENFPTFVANALAKADYFAQQTGLAVLADDSGIMVSALGGPGVRTKRFAIDHGFVGSGKDLDQANNRLLLQKLEGVADRSAHYVCAAAYVDGNTRTAAIGTCSGTIAFEEKGCGGFGYDPLFFIEDLGVTFAELTRAQKNQRSHRARAFRALVTRLKSR